MRVKDTKITCPMVRDSYSILFILRSLIMATTAAMASLPTVLICEAGRMKPWLPVSGSSMVKA